MEKLLMLGTTPTSVELVNKAKARGVYTITTDYLEPEASPAKLVSDEYWMLSTNDVDALEQKCREEGVTAILAGISEFNIRTMIELCRRLGLPCWCTPEVWNNVQTKDNFKRLCRENGVPVATDYFVSNPPTEEELDKIVFPVVVKAVNLHSNWGMSYCYNKDEVVKGCAYARSESNCESVIVERMLHGRQYTMYYALADGKASLLCMAAMFSEPGYPRNCYSITTSVKKHLQLYVDQFEPNITKMFHAAGCREGICWIEMFLDEDGVFYPIEMGYRLPGDMICFPLRHARGFDSLEWLLDIALGQKHTVSDLPDPYTVDCEKYSCSYILWSKTEGVVDRISGVEEIRTVPNMYVRFIAQEGRPFAENQYMLLFAFTAETAEDMFCMIDKINRTIKIVDKEGTDPIIYFDDFNTIGSFL